jgi:excisionase family DNA binding protein
MLEDKNHGYGPTRREGNGPQLVETGVDFEPLLDTDEAAILLRMHPRTLRTKARKGLIPALLVGGRWRFRASTLNHWLEKMVG